MNGHTINPSIPCDTVQNINFDQNHDVFDGTRVADYSVKYQKDIESPVSPGPDTAAWNSSFKSDTLDSFNRAADIGLPSGRSRDGFDRPNLLKRLESIRAWGRNTIKCTKQVIEERLGTTSPTCDENLDLRIESLRQMQKQYKSLLDLVKQFTAGFIKSIQSQRQVAGQLAHLGQQQMELTAEFAYNAETQRLAVLRGEKLLAALETFCDGLNTLINHTFEDTFLTIRQMHSARIEYDAYRKEAEVAKMSPKKPSRSDSPQARRAEEALARFTTCEQNLNKLKAAVDAKLRLLHENRVRVMQHNLLLLHNSTSAYYSGDEERLDAILRQFNVRVKSPNPVSSPTSYYASNTSASHPDLAAQSTHTSPVSATLNTTHGSVTFNGSSLNQKLG